MLGSLLVGLMDLLATGMTVSAKAVSGQTLEIGLAGIVIGGLVLFDREGVQP